MNLKQSLAQELQETHENFFALLNSIPEASYSLPTDNPAWSVRDVLYHITLGPHALSFEIWMIIHARRLFEFGIKYFPSKIFNRINAALGHKGNRISRQSLMIAYGKAHTVIRSRLRRTREEDMQKSALYPAGFTSELADEVTIERLFHHVKGHFETHIKQLERSAFGSQKNSPQ